MDRAYLFAKSRLGSIDASIKLTSLTHSAGDYSYANRLIRAKQHSITAKSQRVPGRDALSAEFVLNKCNRYSAALEALSEQTYIIPKKHITVCKNPYVYTMLHQQRTYAKTITVSHIVQTKMDLTKALQQIKSHYITADNYTLCQPEFSFINCDFSCATLNNFDLSNVNFCSIKLINAKFDFVNLTHANLSGASLAHASLQNSNLFCARLNRADLSNTTLYNSDLRGAQLQQTNLQAADLRGTLFGDADLTDANLREAKLQRVDLHQVKLAGAQLSGAALQGTIFNIVALIESAGDGVDFSDSKLVICFDAYGSLKNINIDQMHVTLKIPSIWDAAALEQQLNHITNPWGCSLLTYIDSLDNAFISQKINFTHQVIDSLSQQIHYTHHDFPREALIDFFASSKHLMKDRKIKDYIARVLYAEIAYINKGGSLARYKEPVLFFMLEIISAPECRAAKRWCMLDNNNFFIQLIAYSAYSSIEQRQNLSRSVYQEYLSLDEVKNYIPHSDIGEGPPSYNGRPDWSDRQLFNYILLNNPYAMIINHEDLCSMMCHDVNQGYIEWNRFFLYKQQQCQALAGVDYLDLFANHFRLFYPGFKSRQSVACDGFLKKLNLAEYEKNFRLAFRHSINGIKYTDNEHQQRLYALFAEKLQLGESGQPTLTSEHYNEIVRHFDLCNSNLTDVAQTLLGLCVVFTLFSSSRFFGTEEDSPQALRNYAYALLKKSNDIAPSVVGDNYDDWANRLLGLGGHKGISCCSSTLSKELLSYATFNFAAGVSHILSPACA